MEQWGDRKVLVGYSLVCLIASSQFWVSISFLLSPIVTCWLLLCLWRLQRNDWRKWEKWLRHLLKFQLYFWAQQQYWRWQNSSWNKSKCSHLPHKMLRYQLTETIKISSKWVLFIVSTCRLPNRRHNLHAKLCDLANKRATWLAAE